MLRQPETQGIHSHFARAVPIAAARVVAGPLRFKYPRAQVAHGVASEQDAVSHRLAEGAIELQHNFGRGLTPVSKVPAAGRQLRSHFHTPAAEEVKGGIVVFDQLVSPPRNPSQPLLNVGQGLGDAGINDKGGFRRR